MTVERATDGQKLGNADQDAEAAANRLRDGIWAGTPGSPDLTPGGGPKPETPMGISGRDDSTKANSQDNSCIDYKFFTDAQGHNNSRLELRNNETKDLLSSRTEIFSDQQPFHQARIDVAVKTAEGQTNYYEEFPTPWTSPIPAFAKIAGPVYKYDPTTDTRIGEPFDKNSAEYGEAYRALTRVREVSTPLNVLVGILGAKPRCSEPEN